VTFFVVVVGDPVEEQTVPVVCSQVDFVFSGRGFCDSITVPHGSTMF
jgi:hypothetical protein